jgi:hypothetical protein
MMTTRRLLLLSTFTAGWLASGPAARAHMPGGSRGPNGGQVQDLGPYHGELIAADGELVLFLFDHRDQPVDARRASGSAVVLSEGRQVTVPFEPRADGSALVARGEFMAGPGLRVVVQVVPGPGVARAQARFAPVGS